MRSTAVVEAGETLIGSPGVEEGASIFEAECLFALGTGCPMPGPRRLATTYHNEITGACNDSGRGAEIRNVMKRPLETRLRRCEAIPNDKREDQPLARRISERDSEHPKLVFMHDLIEKVLFQCQAFWRIRYDIQEDSGRSQIEIR
ncbi:hypothetical protein G7Y89_g287 [Cudoniella acicularis]|uniref:Uncharacterized protein n=1 Tax=Cudoniella acicularis TaxID=354080 RepID=A0A8H4RZ29_9HELO|nr:hypothetical protein G7Y89_g287 [Cudoniella acicularis]